MRKKIVKKIKKLKEFFPLDETMSKSIKDFLDLKYNYNTNAIEWTTFTEQETSFVLKWQTVEKHSLIEHFEVVNHKKAFDYVFEISEGFSDCKKDFLEIFNEEILLKIHSFLLRNINDDFAGRYRNQNVRISFSRTVLPRYEKVQKLMWEFFDKYSKLYSEFDLSDYDRVLEFWYMLHLDFVKIHPFVDWNGRTARLLQNLWFLFALNNLNIVYFKNRREYIETIENSDRDLDGYFEFMDSNFLEFKEEEGEILEERIIFRY